MKVKAVFSLLCFLLSLEGSCRISERASENIPSFIPDAGRKAEVVTKKIDIDIRLAYPSLIV